MECLLQRRPTCSARSTIALAECIPLRRVTNSEPCVLSHEWFNHYSYETMHNRHQRAGLDYLKKEGEGSPPPFSGISSSSQEIRRQISGNLTSFSGNSTWIWFSGNATHLKITETAQNVISLGFPNEIAFDNARISRKCVNFAWSQMSLEFTCNLHTIF